MNPQDRTRAILRSGLDAESKAVAVAICDYMGAEDVGWPSVPTIAADASLSARTVQGRIVDGQRAGWLHVQESRGRASAYSIVWSALPVRPPVVREHDPRRACAPAGHAPPQGVQDTPAGRAGPPPQGVRGKGPVEATREATTVMAPAVADAAPTPAQPPVSTEPPPTPAPPPRTKPAGAPKPPKPEPRTCPGYSEAIALWTRLHREHYPGIAAYPWLFAGKDNDGNRVKAWLAAVRIGSEASSERVAEGLSALETGMRAYLGRAALGTAFPRGEPGTTKFFTSGLSGWLQTDPSAAATGPPSKFQATYDGTERFLARHRTGENADGIL